MENERGISNNFGTAIRYYRERKGYSLQKLFELTGVSPSYLQRLETSQRRSPGLPIITIIAKALEIPVEELIDLSMPGPKKEDAITVAQLILQNDFLINGDLTNKKAKEGLITLIESIVDFNWEGREKNQEIFELLDLVETFKEDL